MFAFNPQQQILPHVPYVEFWRRGSPAFIHTMTLRQRGRQSGLEDAVWHMWTAICNSIFANYTVLPDDRGPRWDTLREPYRGVPPESISRKRPDIVTKAALTPQDVPVVRDHLWVECKAPVHGNASGWRTLLAETATRLATAHPDRDVWVIAAIGTQASLWRWQPGTTARPLHIRSANRRTTYPVDVRLRPIGPCPWVDDATLEFRIYETLQLAHAEDENAELLYTTDQCCVERFLFDVRALPLPGNNTGF